MIATVAYGFVLQMDFLLPDKDMSEKCAFLLQTHKYLYCMENFIYILTLFRNY